MRGVCRPKTKSHVTTTFLTRLYTSYLQTNIEFFTSTAVSDAISEISNFRVLSLWMLFNYAGGILGASNSSLAGPVRKNQSGSSAVTEYNTFDGIVGQIKARIDNHLHWWRPGRTSGQ
jgi:hypothetical protein